jgi:Resolvase, N terminal domain
MREWLHLVASARALNGGGSSAGGRPPFLTGWSFFQHRGWNRLMPTVSPAAWMVRIWTVRIARTDCTINFTRNSRMRWYVLLPSMNEYDRRREAMRVGIYARVSTKDQSCELQLRDLRTFCVARNFTVIREYVDIGESGAKDSRPQLNELL